MASSSYPPVRGQAFDLYFTIPKADGSNILSPAGLACRVVVDGRGYDGPTPELVDSSSGTCVARLYPLLTSGAVLFFRATSSSTDALPYTERIQTAAQTLNTMAARERRRKGGGWR